MTETASLVIKVDSSGAKSASADLDRLTDASGKAERATDGLSRAWRTAAGVLSAAAVARVTRAYLDAADAAANMSARLRLATKSQEEFTAAHRATFRIAQSAGTELEGVVNLYGRLAQSSAQLGLSQAQVAQLTETVTQAFIVSGATSQEAAGGIRQLTQALAGGTLRAEEFNSIIESSPRIVQALADHFGVSFGEVRRLVNDGKISSEQFAAAMLNASDKIGAEFRQMPLTVSRATQEVRNALMQLVGDTENTSGATRDLASAIADLARTLESEELKQGFASTVGGINQIIQATLSASGYLDRLRGVLAGLELQGNAAFQSLNPMNWTPSNLRRLEDQYRRGAAYAENGWSAMQPSATVGVPIPDGMRSGPRGRRTRATEAEVAATASYGKTISADLQREIDKIREQAAAYGLSRLELAKLNQEKALSAAKNDAEREAIRNAYGELIKAIEADEKATAGKKAATEAAEKQKRAIEELARAYDGYLDRLNRGIALHGQNTELARLNYEIQYGALKGISEEQAAILREAAQWRDWQEEMADIEKVWAQTAQEAIDASIARMAKATDEMSEFARQAARNMQSSFADFLFDPFKDGVSGMVRGFADALRRMAAEAAAAKIFEAIGAWGKANAGAGGFVGTLAKFAGMFAGGGRAAGGPVMAGQAYLVGEGGKPELFVPGQSGRVMPVQGAAAGGGNVQVQVNNYTGGQVRTREERTRGPDGTELRRLIVDVLADDLASGGKSAAVLRNRFGLREAS